MRFLNECSSFIHILTTMRIIEVSIILEKFIKLKIKKLIHILNFSSLYMILTYKKRELSKTLASLIFKLNQAFVKTNF